jgi:hypothetical protein
VRRSQPGINVEVAQAVHRVATLYAQIPGGQRPDVTGERWDELEAEIARRSAAGDREGALRAIAEWEAHARRVLGGSLA